MRNPFWRKHMSEESQHRQPGCMWALVHMLDYHHWRAPIHHKLDSTSEHKLYALDGFETAKLLYGDDGSLHLHTKKSKPNKKKSLRARVKAFIGADFTEENQNLIDKERFVFERELQETYLSLNVDWKHPLPLILVPGNVDTPESKTSDKEEANAAKPNNADDPDILEIFKVDKSVIIKHLHDKTSDKEEANAAKPNNANNPDILEIFEVEKGVLRKHLHDADETISNFFCAALCLNTKPKLSRSRSFPSAELSKGKKVEFVKLETSWEDHYKLPDTSSNSSLWLHGYNSDSDMCYVRHLLDQSGVAVDPLEMTWHASDQPLSLMLFEKVEACWPHEKDQLWPECFYGCWHHRMLFDLVNEAILEIYDVPLPCYPKALSSRCYVQPFPVGNRMIEEVSAHIGTLLNLEPEETLQSLEFTVAWDLVQDLSSLNLQLEMECVGVELEDAIFYELVEEVVSGNLL